MVTTAHSMSLDGFIADADYRGAFRRGSKICDVDMQLARKSREALARELEGSDIPAAATHFPRLQFGRLLAAEGRRQWTFE
jgi:hypothetical protein